jgi:hypothetical protein
MARRGTKKSRAKRKADKRGLPPAPSPPPAEPAEAAAEKRERRPGPVRLTLVHGAGEPPPPLEIGDLPPWLEAAEAAREEPGSGVPGEPPAPAPGSSHRRKPRPPAQDLTLRRVFIYLGVGFLVAFVVLLALQRVDRARSAEEPPRIQTE